MRTLRYPAGPQGIWRARSIPFRRLPVIQFQVTFISSDMDLTPVDRVLHGASGLVGVRAVGESTVVYVRAKLEEMTFELAGNHAPELELAEAWRIDHVTALLEPNQLGGRCGVFSFECPVGYFAHFQVQPGLDRVEEELLPTPLWPDRAVTPRPSKTRRRSIPRPSVAEVTRVSYPS